MSLSSTVSEILSLIFQNLKRLRDSEHLARQNLNGSRKLATPFLGIDCHLCPSTCYISMETALRAYMLQVLLLLDYIAVGFVAQR